MSFSREQKQEAYKKLTSEVQDFIMSSETTELIDNYLKEVTLSETQSNDADSEILFAMYGLQTLPEAIQNIAKLSNKNVSDLSKLQKNLEENIFSKINLSKLASDQEEKLTKVYKSNPLGKSFEETILNQAKGMMPARHASQGDAGGPARPADEDMRNEVRSTSYEEREKNNKPVSVPNYSKGNDPYREPLQ
jgi:hypothetical protein